MAPATLELRRSRETLLTLLEAFVYDPLVGWESDRGREEQRKGAELSVGLQLAASRVDELVEQLSEELTLEQLLVLLHIAVAAVCGMAQGAAPRPLARRLQFTASVS